MRDPLVPIPSPHARGARAERYWDDAPLPPPPTAEQRRAEIEADPRRLVAPRADGLGIDRRAVPRPHGVRGTAVAAAVHAPFRKMMALGSRQGWALVRGLSLGPEGVLVQVVDLLDPELDPRERTQARAAFRRLLASHRRTTPTASALAWVGGCVLAPRVVADLGRWANPPTPGPTRPVGVTLWLGPPGTDRFSTPVAGRIAALTDPRPGVLGIALSPTARSRLVWTAGLPARPRRAASAASSSEKHPENREPLCHRSV